MQMIKGVNATAASYRLASHGTGTSLYLYQKNSAPALPSSFLPFRLTGVVASVWFCRYFSTLYRSVVLFCVVHVCRLTPRFFSHLHLIPLTVPLNAVPCPEHSKFHVELLPIFLVRPSSLAAADAETRS